MRNTTAASHVTLNVGITFAAIALSTLSLTPSVYSALPSSGSPHDGQTSVAVDTVYGMVSVDAPTDAQLMWIKIDSAAGIFTGGPAVHLNGSWDFQTDHTIFKATPEGSFGSICFGTLAQPGLSEEFLLNDLSAIGSLVGGGSLGNVDFIYDLRFPEPGDANSDLSFDEVDLVQVQIAGKYLTEEAATWGEGDWPFDPPSSDPPWVLGDGVFNQLDIVAALQTGRYLNGPCLDAPWPPPTPDGQTFLVYNHHTGELSVDTSAGVELTSINIDSAAGIFTGQAAQNLGGSFDNDTDNNIFKATFGSSFRSLSFGTVAQPGLREDFLLADLSVIGSLKDGGPLGDVNLIFVPEPASLLLLILGCCTAVRSRYLLDCWRTR